MTQLPGVLSGAKGQYGSPGVSGEFRSEPSTPVLMSVMQSSDAASLDVAIGIPGGQEEAQTPSAKESVMAISARSAAGARVRDFTAVI